MNAFSTVPPPAITRILSRFERAQLAGFIAVAIDLLDAIDQPGDPDAPDFSPADDGYAGSPDDGEYSGDEVGDQAWAERLDQSKVNTCIPEDTEDDDGGGDCTDDEPGFDRQSRRIANALGGGYPGCPISDPDHDGVEFAERDEAESAPARYYGVDQSREIGPDNPAA